jgi:hypothetical protein
MSVLLFVLLICSSQFDLFECKSWSDEETMDRYDRTVKFVLDNGGMVSDKLEFRVAAGGKGSGYFARAPVAADEHLVVLPRKATLEYTADIVKRFPEFSPLPKGLHTPDDRALWALGMALMPDHPYMFMCPDDCINSVTLPKKYTGDPALIDSVLISHADELRQRAIKDYAALLRIYPRLMAQVDRTLFRKAYCWFETRSFGPTGEDNDTASMLPLGDLFNHSPDYGVIWTYDPANQSWIFYATRVIQF